MKNSKSELVKLGFAIHPHGIKGEVELRLLSPEDTVLEEGMKVWLFPGNEKSALNPVGEEWTIKRLRFGNKVISLFEGISDRTHLEKLLPFEIHLTREAFPELEDEVYLVDLIDMDVVDEEGRQVGKLESFADNREQYLFNIRLKNGEIVTLPYVKTFFPEIDMENKKITMIMPEYIE